MDGRKKRDENAHIGTLRNEIHVGRVTLTFALNFNYMLCWVIFILHSLLPNFFHEKMKRNNDRMSFCVFQIRIRFGQIVQKFK